MVGEERFERSQPEGNGFTARPSYLTSGFLPWWLESELNRRTPDLQSGACPTLSYPAKVRTRRLELLRGFPHGFLRPARSTDCATSASRTTIRIPDFKDPKNQKPPPGFRSGGGFRGGKTSSPALRAHLRNVLPPRGQTRKQEACGEGDGTAGSHGKRLTKGFEKCNKKNKNQRKQRFVNDFQSIS